jgi:putative beta-barrel porin
MKTGLKLSWLFFLLNLSTAFAQFPGSGTGGSATPAQQEPVEPDTFNVRFFYQTNLNLLTPFTDTLLNNRLEHYDPARQRDVDYIQLGNLGTAINHQLYETRNHLGLDVGLHQYDLYQIRYQDIPFYKIKKPFSDLYFAQGPTQQDTYFKGRFTRNFGKGINFSVDYKRMNNVGQFKSQAVINSALGLGWWYHHKDGKYNAFFNFVSNSNDIEDNGGVDFEKLPTTNIDRVFNIPVYLREARTFYVNREYAFTQQYNLLGKADSLDQETVQRNFILSHDLVYRKNAYKFYDTAPDSAFYKHLLVDTRGLRHFIRDNSIANTFAVITSKSGKESQRDLLKVSLEHQLHFLNQEPKDSTINHLILGGQWNFSPSERLKVQTFFNYNLWDNFGDYRLGGELFLDFKKAGTFKASMINQLYSPSLIQQRMYISEQLLWKNDFSKTIETSVSATYSLPKLRFSATGQYHLLNNLIYFDTLAFAKQISVPVNILQLIIKQDFKVWKIHLDNTIALQTATEEVIRLPSFFSKHNLYFEGKVFKKIMLLRIGMDLRLVNSYYANYYQPLIGQFQLQDSQEVELYPAVDSYASFKIKNFRFFLRGENLTHFLSDKLYFQTAGYAQPYFTLKFGISWQLLN